ncbi:TonB-dependent receptor plug [Fibrella aestuarina BUZ 2]|uniref:TonB-dependent receptor plug n=1 Tax=Fibrella aestuarina BUZ 2 TaxID=1166018 RepID=I0K8B6_9BACT|nr:SusC/RagA family TonB-linked outer membrane protein [Fibrella aestuarina]CCH00369.1 TonB-dependent receptor plug [Fibrella aestuarina BUZ 2]
MQNFVRTSGRPQRIRHGASLVLLCLLATLTLAGHCFGQQTLQTRVSLSAQNSRLDDVLTQLGTQAQLRFVYSGNTIAADDRVSLSVQNQPLNQVLDRLLSPRKLAYALVGQNQVVIRQAEERTQRPAATVTGRVTDAKTGDGIPGVNVLVRGTQQGTTTDVDGRYSLNVPSDRSELSFSFVGYLPQTIPIGNRSTINVLLAEDARSLNEVVVTALGIKREEKALGYATQKLDGNAVTDAPANSVVNALSGKVAGLNLTKTDGPMGSSRVTLRGESILDLNSPGALIVVDGEPISTGFQGVGHGAYLGGDSPVDFGSALTDIDPNNIESINVLKGPAASALYGSRAGSGAIIITTKSGKRDQKGIGVTLNSYISVDDVNRWPDYQYEYGQGTAGQNYYSYGTTADGPGTHNTSSAWGPRFDGQSFFQYDSPRDANGLPTARTPWVPYKDNRKDFFRKGITLNNNISISNNGDKGTTRLSLSHLKNDWILPNTGYQRISVGFSNQSQISTNLSTNVKLNYYNKFSDNLPTTGYNNQSIMYFLAFQNPNINLDWYKPYWVPGREGIEQSHPFSSLIDNPYLIVNEMLNKSNRHNITGNVSATYTLLKGLDLTLHGGLDAGYEFRSQQRPMNTQKFQAGMYRQQNVFNVETNTDFLLRYQLKPSADFQVTANAGGNVLIQSQKFTNQLADRLVIPGVYNLANSEQLPLTRSDRADKQINSLYGFVNLAYKNVAFFDITGRNDWSSTLPRQNNSFFYPSTTLSLIVSDIVKLPSWVSYAKVRGAYASVGYDARLGTYNLEKVYEPGVFPGELENPNIIANPNLRPQRNNSWEAGTEWRLFKNRLSFDLTVYRQLTIDQILYAPVEYASGYNSSLINMGRVVNRGIELTLTGSPIKNARGFNWDATLNWAMNRNMVEELNNGTGSVVLARYVGSRVTLEAREGRPLGELYGLGFKRSPDGQIVYDKTGYPLLTDQFINLGTATPKWRGGLANTFRYRGLSLSVLIDHQQGGRVYSLTNSVLGEQGKITATLPGRYDGLIGPGVTQNADGTYVPNTTKAANIVTYYSRLYGRDNVEANTFDATFTKLREVRLAYTLPPSVLGKTFLRGATIGIYGRDLYNWTKFPGFDPETSTLDNSTITPGLEIAQFPSTRTMGANLTVSF